MSQSLSSIAIVVRDYDEALAYYTDTLGFECVEDTPLGGGKRFVRVRPPGSEASLLLARASGDAQQAAIGNQTGGRVFLFLDTDDFGRDYAAYRSRGVAFREEPRQEAYGTVAVFADLYGNLWDLVERKR
jgi:catechol 2,3-dioxygenase-like lactoylglutathione lyase family enzyme